MDKPLRILHLEDDPDYCRLVKAMLEKAGLAVETVAVDNYADFTAALERDVFDVILADYSLPTCNGFEALKTVRQKCPDTPFLLVSGTIGEQAAIESLTSGATDYVLKHWPERLAPAVRRAVQETQERAQRKQAEAHLRLQSTALEAAANAIIISDRAGVVSWVNPAFTQLTGYSAREVVGQNPRLLKSGQHDQDFYRNLWETILAGRVWHAEMVNRRKDGGLYTEECTITPVRDERGEITHFIAVKQDVSARKYAERALWESEQRFSVFMAHLPVAAFVADQDSHVLFANKYVQETFGWREWEGKSILELFPSETARLLADNDRKALAQGLLVVQEKIVDARGRERTFETYRFPLRIEGKPVLLGGIAVDITERKELESQLRQAQKMEAVGQLAGGVAHDFNNILTVIRGHASLLSSEEKLSDSTAKSLQQISQAADRAAGLTRQLLAFSRRQVLQPRLLDMNEVVSNMTKMLGRILGEDIALQLNYAPQLPRVEADAGMMEQVLMNLAVNSRDAMPKGGLLSISIFVADVDPTHVARCPEARVGKFVCLSVTDSGSGIAPENLRHIFEPFFTTKEVGKGTGLGLAMVYGIVKQHHGWLEVESEPGKGTTFRVYLSASTESAQPCEEAVAQKAVRGGTETILVVEDETPVRELARDFLARCGYKVLHAESGVKALEVWEQNGDKIDLLLTDLIMPDRLNGRELAQKLWQQRPKLKVIFTSGYSADVAGKDFILRRGFQYLQKPYDLRTLASTVRNCLDAR